jgi:AcrR family transcriptional regulator
MAGYRGTTMRDIAEAAHILAGSLYSHFDSKLAILQELMDSYFAELLPRQREVLEQPGSVLVRLQEMVVVFVSVAHQHPEVAMVVALDWHDIVTIPELVDVVADARETNTLFRVLLEEGIRTKELRPDVNVEAVARMLGSAITGLIDRRYLIWSEVGGQGSDFTADEIAAVINMLLVGGLVQPAPAAPVAKVKTPPTGRTPRRRETPPV